jgi:hypothetical protein
MADGIVNFGLIQPEASNAFLRGFQGSQERQSQLAQQQRQNALLDLQLRTAQRGEEESLAEREAYKGAAGLGDVQQRLMQAGLGKQSIALQKQMQEQKATQIKQAEEELKIGRGIAERAFAAGRAASMSAPGTEKAAVLSVLKQYQGRGIDLTQDLSEIANLPDAQVLEHVFNKSQELKNLSEMITTDTGAAILRTPRFQQPGMPAQQPAGAFQGEPQQVMNQLATIADPAERAAATEAYQRQLTAQAPMAGTRIPKALSPVQELQERRAQEQLGMERERLDLSKEEAIRKRAEVPSETRKELTSIDQQRSVIDGALKAVKDTPNAFSFARGAVAGALPYGESLAGRLETPEQTQARAYVFNNVSRVINERAGAAQSAQEMQRLRSFLPADTDNAEQITNKLKGFQTYLKDLEKGTIKATSPATKEALEKTRGVQLSDIDKQALEWANSNPNDPRAAQIKQKLGAQ